MFLITAAYSNKTRCRGKKFVTLHKCLDGIRTANTSRANNRVLWRATFKFPINFPLRGALCEIKTVYHGHLKRPYIY